ncbi:acyltransferase [Rhizobium laguerreae]|uniref:acyltransferase family protein n=1 Tax=Rhizobium laguerreae TaxID=1076926 RepID=UPI00144220C1|nr:acyltransferase [Rhizobium laguerreae]MBY3502835.1 acyltransferase [Rhizobium laguerreae]MBY3576102.1 acyltransferase [Rhizobium laguerreae]NKN04496.1 acyltransferase family protein [Rhizobium laguerreae]
MQHFDERSGEERLQTTSDSVARSTFPAAAYPGPSDAQDLGHGAGQAKGRFIFLDELRGLAALSVVLLHASQIFSFRLNSHSYLAVDFFFCLSGFVLANGYDQTLKSGALGSKAFFLKRVVRLYPMIVVGVGLGVIASQVALTPRIALADVSILAVGALILLPLGLLVGQEAFAINNPLWSICFEMVASVAYGCIARRRFHFWYEIAAIALLAAALFQVVMLEGGIGPVGFASWRAFLEGFIRVGFSFLAGVLIFRWRIYQRVGAAPPQIPLFVLIAVLIPPFSVPNDIYDFICIAVIIPIVVALAAAVPQGAERPFAAYLGQLSYPLYAVHLPVIQFGDHFQNLTDGFIPLPVTVGGTLLVAVGVAHFLHGCFDAPLRAYLGRKFPLN